jgi:NADH-quinone oxidoreductase subunit M
MIALPFPLMALAIVIPAVYGLIIARMRDEVVARRHATIAATAVLALVAAVVIAFRARGAAIVVDAWTVSLPGVSHPLLGVDSLSAPLLPLVALIALATVIARPRRIAAPHTLGALLMTEALVIGLLTALHLGLLALFWIASAVPALIEARRRQALGAQGPLTRTWALFLLLGALPLVAGTVVLLIDGVRAGVSLHLADLVERGLHTHIEIAAGLLIGLAVLLRSAVVPVHSWLPMSFEHGPPGMVSLLWATQPSAYLLARVLMPIFPDAAEPFRVILAALGLFTAVYAALVGLAQTDLKRIVGLLATSYGGIVLIGLSSSHADGIAGGLMLWISAGVAITGLSLVVVAVEARTGTTDIRRLGGLAHTMPRAAMVFAVFGLAAVGLPGMLGFVGEDMLIHGVLESYPAVAALLLVAGVFNGITVMRAFARAFLGQAVPWGVKVPPGRDLRPRERVAVIVLAAILAVFGLMPGPLVSARSQAAVDLAAEPGAHP